MMRRKQKTNAQILDEAATWYVDFSTGEVDETGRREFNRWLRTSPEHVRAYLQTSALWEGAALLTARRTLDAEALIAQALQDDVTPLHPLGWLRHDGSVGLGAAPVWRRARAWRWGAASAAAALLAAVGMFVLGPVGAKTYSTDTGELRSIALADGSHIDLDSRSRVRIRFSKVMRLVELDQGQALFRVAHESGRPFVVESGETHVLAVGTQFNVQRRSQGVTVTVIEGLVAVTEVSHASATAATAVTAEMPTIARLVADGEAGGSAAELPEAAPADTVFLSAGEQMTAGAVAPTPPAHVNVAAATVWTRHQLLFDSSPLTEVAREYDRYNKRPIVIMDPALRDFRVSGMFSATDASALVEFLRAQPSLQVRVTNSAIEVSSKER